MRYFVLLLIVLSLLAYSCTDEKIVNTENSVTAQSEDITLTKQKSITPPEGLICWWPGDKNTLDYQNDYDGVLYNGAEYEKGLVKHAFKFEREGWDEYSADYFLASDVDVINNLQEVTMEMWVRLDGTPMDQRFRVERFMTIAPPEIETASIRFDGGGPGYPSPGQLHCFMRINGELHGVGIWNVLEVGTFYHVAATYDGKFIRLYLDGAEIGNEEIEGSLAEGNGLVRLSSPDEPLEGIVDEACIYNRALTGDEIKSIFDAGKWGKKPKKKH